MTTLEDTSTPPVDLSWFAMSATFGRELKAKEYLESKNVECFVPMRWSIVADRQQKKSRQLVPAIKNLIFAHTTKEHIQELKRGVNYLQYLTCNADGRRVPIIVPDGQMQQFIAVCESHDDRLVYLSPEEINLSEGTRVRIIGGGLDGVEGTFVKVKNKRKKRVVVEVRGVAAVMLAEFTDGYLQVLE